MTITAFAGPLVTFGKDPYGSANPDEAASLLQGGAALADLRVPYGYRPGMGAAHSVYGWGGQEVLAVNAVPSTLAADNIAAAAVPVDGTAMTLVSSSAAGITVGQSIVNARTGAAVTGLLVIDGAVTPLGSGPVKLWDPADMLARNVRITSVGNDSGATFTVRGYDANWFPVTETITGANAGVASGVKAFKYIASVTPAGTLSGSNASVGTGDVYGFPLQALQFELVRLFWAGAGITASTGFTAAVVTDPATAITGDVRGTYAVQSASNGSRRLVAFVTVPPGALITMNGALSLYGITQFSS